MISIWNASTGQELRTLHQGRDRVMMVRFSPDDRQIAAVNWDGTANLWDATNGLEMLNLPSESKWLTSVAFSADGRRLANSNGEGLVQVYARDIHDLLTLARQRVTRPLTVPECRTYFQTDICPALP